MSTTILGISAYYHDSAAALVRDGEILAAAQEERFTRKKQDARFPRNAVDYCLREAGITPTELTHVAFYDKPLLKFERILQTYLGVAPSGIRQFYKAMPLWLKEKLGTHRLIRDELPGFKRRILFGEHHESHAASAFYPSPYEEAAVLTIDGVGEWATTTFGHGKGNELEILGQIDFPHSVGMLYSAFTYYTGFKVNSGEYKVMGLAPYGEPRFVDKILEHVMELRDDGSFQLKMDHFDFLAGLKMTSSRFDEVFGGPPRKPETQIAQREMDLAASVQVVTEMAMERQARYVKERTGCDYLCLAGGVALNCVSNGKLLRTGLFKDVWIQPAAGDAGGALGVALAVWHKYLKQPRTVRADGRDSQSGSYLGPRPDNEQAKQYFERLKAPYTEVSAEELPEKVAELLASENVVGLCQGRMEFGPRALGGRSIMGDARSQSMQRTMNLKIKYRESFRPFAPSVLAEDVGEWFEQDRPSPYMLLVAPVQEDKRIPMTEEQSKLFGIEKLNVPRSSIPAVTHVDYSARIQTVDGEDNPVYHAIIKAFREKTGCPVVVNTSFNVRGEPIVCTTEDAYRCFMRTEMDYLVVEQCILAKTDQPEFKEDGNWRDEFELDQPHTDPMTTTTESTPNTAEASPGAGTQHSGLSPLNHHGAAVHHDLFAVAPDPVKERAELKRQSRILGLGFLVMFTGIIGGLSFTFNGAWKAGYGANFPRLPYVPLPSESAEAAEQFRAAPPQFQIKNGGAQEWRATEHLDLRHDPQDDLEPSALQDLTPIQLYLNRSHVGTCYARLNPGEVPARLRRPNLEPVPVRASLPNAIEQARLFGMLPTCYPAGFGLLMGALALVAPVLLIPFYSFWMRAVTAPLGWFNTRLILGIVFYLMFTPLALGLRVRRLFSPQDDALGRSPRPKDESYWKLREKKRPHTHYRRLF